MMIRDALRANLHARVGALSQHFELQTKHKILVTPLGAQELISRNLGSESTSDDGALLKSEGLGRVTFPAFESLPIKQRNPLRSTASDCEAEQSQGYSQRQCFPPTLMFYECEMHWRLLRQELIVE